MLELAVLPIKVTSFVEAVEAVVEKLEVVLFSKHLIRLKIQFIGHISKLKSALMLEDIKLIKKEGDWYISSIQKDGEITIE